MRWFCAVLTGVLAVMPAPGQRKNYAQPLHRTDMFLAARYDAESVAIFFSDEGNVRGTPHGWKQQTGKGIWDASHLLVVQGDAAAKTWRADWPANGGAVPKVGDSFRVDVGSGRYVHVELKRLAFLPGCRATWMAGIARVADADMAAFHVEAREPFLALKADAVEVKESASLMGAASLSTAPDFPLVAKQRAALEGALKLKLQVDYTSLLSEREQLYQQTHPTPLAQVNGSDALLKETATLVYLVQRVTVAPGIERYYVRAEWKSGDRVLYVMRAWFTPAMELETVTDSEVPRAGGMRGRDDLESDALDLHAGQLRNVFAWKHTNEMGEQVVEHLLLMQLIRGRYMLMRWTPGGILPAGVSFGLGC